MSNFLRWALGGLVALALSSAASAQVVDRFEPDKIYQSPMRVCQTAGQMYAIISAIWKGDAEGGERAYDDLVGEGVCKTLNQDFKIVRRIRLYYGFYIPGAGEATFTTVELVTLNDGVHHYGAILTLVEDA